MHLKALELTGFKSFAEKTTVEFNRGITSIVGPNGSGKSNILDAILWVLGEQSYKNIRAKESSDVIFSGGKNKKPRSVAEVSLIVENEDRYLDIDYPEVRITRRIHKTGENEYFINNRKTRLKDINNLFMDTGIGKQAYSIIGQGRVERIISSNPRELREIIEEAAGVKRAKVEKDESIKKLKEVKNEIEKIEFVEKELFSRVEYLREEERKARLFKTFSDQIELQKFMILEYNIGKEEEFNKENLEKRNEVQKNLEELQKEYDLKQKELESVVKDTEEKYAFLEKEKNEDIKLSEELEAFKEEHSNLINKLSNLEIQSKEKEEREKVLKGNIVEKEAQLLASEAELSEILEKFEKKENRKKEVEAKVEKLKEKKERHTLELKELIQQNHDLEVDKIKASGENEDLEKRVFIAEAAIKRQLKEREVIQENLLKMEEEKAELERNKAAKEAEKEKAEIRIKEINLTLESLNMNYSIINKEKNELNYKYENLNARKKANENIIEKNETFAKAVKYILNENIKGVVGAFINLIDIPEGYEEAIQTLSGGYFQDIVVNNGETGKKCIELLKQKKLGRASFLPLEEIKSFKIKNGLPEEEGVIDFARNIVKYDESLKKVVEFVYGNGIVVKDMKTGTKLLKKGFNERIATLDGDIITSGGRMTGGYYSKGKDEFLERKRELKRIYSEIEKISSENKKIVLRREQTEKEIKKEEENRDRNLIILEKFNNGYNEFIKKYDSFNLDYNKIKKEEDVLNFEINENEEFIKSKKIKIEENIAVMENIEKLLTANKLNIMSLNNELSDDENLEEYIKELGELDKDYEILKVKTESNKIRYSEIRNDCQKMSEEREELLKFQENKTILKNEIEERLSLEKLKIKENSEKSEKNRKIIKELEEKIRFLEKNEKELIKTVKDIEMKKKDEENEYGKLKEKTDESSRKLKAYSDEIKSISFEKIKDMEEYTLIKSETELLAMKRKLSLNEKSRMEIGNVNLSSIEEYKRENGRYRELVNQKKDLQAAGDSILTLIEEIEEEIVEKFNFSLNEINENFKYMCENILNGAKGSIRLLDEKNLLETGLELSVKYKNKPEQTLMLLSGGEKSMLAVSFIMAIFMFKPSPFTFFDEIEAALDEENTKKIVKLLNRFISKSQFILITHNKETMKGSHRLYGVTMNKEIGESKIVSVDV